jgi:hypothetical protein
MKRWKQLFWELVALGDGSGFKMSSLCCRNQVKEMASSLYILVRRNLSRRPKQLHRSLSKYEVNSIYC